MNRKMHMSIRQLTKERKPMRKEKEKKRQRTNKQSVQPGHRTRLDKREEK